MDLILLVAGYVVISGMVSGLVQDYDSIVKMLLFGLAWPFTLPLYVAHVIVTWFKSFPSLLDKYFTYKKDHEEMRHKHSLIEMKRRAEYELEVRYGLVDKD